MLATYSYDDLGRRISLVLGDGTSANYAYDAVSRLASHGINLAGSAGDVTATFGYNPAGQIASRTRSNGAYANPAANRADSYTANGLNQLTAAAGATVAHDARGNVAGVGSTAYDYTSDNLLKSVSTGATFGYDGVGRLIEYNTNVSRRFVFDGGQIAAEVNNPSGAITRRYVSGPGADEVLVEYDGATRRFLHADERGSIVALTNPDGTAAAINTYDDYGVPAPGNQGRFGYTGQAWLPEIGLSYYKARMYAPTLGRFMQTDPIGYADGLNWYAYVGNDPVNFIDLTGLTRRCVVNENTDEQGNVTERFVSCGGEDGGGFSGFSGFVLGSGIGGGRFVSETEGGGSTPGEAPQSEEELRKKIAEGERRSRSLSRQICLRATIEGAAANVVGGAALAGTGAGVAFDLGRSIRAIGSAPFPTGQVLNTVRASGPALLAGAIAGYVIGAVQGFSGEPTCS